MARPPAPCGTYPAYRRHLRKRENVDAACRRAQRDHDSERSLTLDEVTPRVVTIPARPKSLQDQAEDLRAAVLAKARTVVAAAERDHVYDVIDASAELDRLIDSWCEVLDDIEHERGYPGLPEALRMSLLASP